MRNKIFFALATPLVLIGSMVGANLGQFAVINNGVSFSAEREALQWSKLFVDEIPDVTLLFEDTGSADRDRQLIGDITSFEDVFWFALYDKTGQQFFALDDTGDAAAPSFSASPPSEVAAVLETGQSGVTLVDGPSDPALPRFFSKAFVPVFNDESGLIGVAEVHIDQSEIARTFRDGAMLLSVVLTSTFTIVMGLLYLAFQIKKSQESKSRRKVDYLANFDQLTGLLNRAGFTAALAEFGRRGDLGHAVVLFMDIDHFKAINNTNGHQVGDAFLRHFGDAIATSLAPNDIAGRFGGDEFVIVARRASIEQARALAENVSKAVSKPVVIDGSTVVGNISVGIHYEPRSAIAMSERMQKADIALYQAKLDGRNTCRVFTPDLELAFRRRHTVERAIRSGLEDRTFSLHFQPLLDRVSRKTVGFEALLRLNDAENNPIPPNEFIPVAESMGLIEEIGSRVLLEAARTAITWPDPIFVAVNLSARQFDKGNLQATVEHVLKTTGLDPSRLELEVTESLLMENTESVSAQLERLRALGVSLAMDDFGTGYSSLGYLWQFGFDKLKIDGSFIAGLEHGGEKIEQLLDTIVMMGHRLNMTVTAEGIETEQQAKVLSDLSCDVFQGYLYGRPMPRSDLAAYLLGEVSHQAKQHLVARVEDSDGASESETRKHAARRQKSG